MIEIIKQLVEMLLPLNSIMHALIFKGLYVLARSVPWVERNGSGKLRKRRMSLKRSAPTVCQSK